MTLGRGSTEGFLSIENLREIVEQAAETRVFDGKRVLVIIPDGTRTMPMPEMFALLCSVLKPRTKCMDFLVALGTHPPMTDAQLSKLLGCAVINEKAGDIRIFNHHWEVPENFVRLGTISAGEISQITSGLMSCDVNVSLNRLVLDYDYLVVCGPVFPHEVVGFSGGNKYFFPGIAGSEIINFTHWLGAVITNFDVIGAGYTPVRAVIDRAAEFIPRATSCFALVVTHEGVAGMYYGTPREAWNEASALSAKKHIVYVDRPFKRVLSVMPEMYDDLWTAAKGMYKIEPAVEAGGEVIIYSPAIDEVSYTHGKLLDEVGYHCRDYFLKQWKRFEHYPGGVLAHSTHVKGLGHYDATTGVETTRIKVTLATGIPEERCRRINLAYMDPATIDLNQWRGREDEGIVLIPRAGETLFRVRNTSGARAS